MSPTLHESLLSFFGWVIRGSFMAGILVLLVLALQFLLKNKLEARWKYLIWLPVAIRLLLPWAPESSLSLYNVLSLKAVAPGIHQMTQDPPVWKEAGGAGEAAVHGERYLKPETSGISEIPALSHESGTVQERGLWWNKIKQQGFTNGLMLVWLAGVLFLASKTVYDQLRLKRALRAGRSIETPFLSAVFQETKQLMGINRKVRFVASERIPGPAVVGFREPAVVISPRLLVTLRKEQLQYILAHEFAHIQRRDVAVNWVIHIILILHWFNPLIWLAVYKARQNQEMACDAYVLDRMRPKQNSAYGQTIIHVLEHISSSHHKPGLAGMSATHKEMKRRLMMIKQFNKKSYRLSVLGMGMILALGSVTLVNAKEKSVPQKASVQVEQDSKATEAAQEQQQSDKKKLQIDETVAAKLQKVLKQFAGKEIKLQDVGKITYDYSNNEHASVESVDGKYGISFETKNGKVWSVFERIPLDKISKKDQDKALQELKKLSPNKTFEFEKEVDMFRNYDDEKAKFHDSTLYQFNGKNFSVGLSNSFTENKTDFKAVSANIDVNELEPKVLKTAEEAVKTVLNQDINFKWATLSHAGWSLNNRNVIVEIDVKSNKVINVINMARMKEKVTTDKEITANEAKEVIAPMAKKFFNIDITGYEVKWDNESKNYRFVENLTTEKGAKIELTIVRATLDANKNVVSLTSEDKAATGGWN
ncbi:BlaR1 peptidase M56 [Paenibacillus tianmuensis]|uniref:BlaR1 peptidase M56 n=1 Tax=Paenibacillus tianmuensis TaxID=624147 RepID=A0A1G4S9T3_9BACL|nr:M56 family metallopeptidase [Paenibacillus tianmuensis]SCW65972.1 BlaR1 peptidase M56 [Paenibacillus tianmuensis]